jgi:hypothetical protein
MCGCIRPSDAYYGAYHGTEQIFYSFEFWGVGKVWEDYLPNSIHVYLGKRWGKRFADRIIGRQENLIAHGKHPDLLAYRIKAVLDPRSLLTTDRGTSSNFSTFNS